MANYDMDAVTDLFGLTEAQLIALLVDGFTRQAVDASVLLSQQGATTGATNETWGTLD